MVSRARFTADLIATINANTSALSNAIYISSADNVTVANSVTVSGNIPGYATNTYVYATFAQNTAITNLVSDRIQVANADVLYVTKSTALTSNTAVVNLVNDRLQVANAAVTYVTKAVHLSSNTAVKGLIDDRLQVANAAVTYVTKATALAANNTLVNLTSDRLQVANAAVTYVTKGTALTSNNALVNLINDRLQVANAGVTYLTKSFALTSNTALVNLINDRIQAANVSTTLGTYWPSANVISYTNSQVAASTKVVNTSIYIATGGENRVSIPYTNTNYLMVYLNGILLTETTDYVAANNAHIGGLSPALVAGDVLVVEEFKNHNANTVNRSAGGGGGASGFQGSTSGYTFAGIGPIAHVNTIDKYSFSSDGNATDVGDAIAPTGFTAGQSSTSSGYATGGYPDPSPATFVNSIQKFPFASDTNASSIPAVLTADTQYASGQSSPTSGYTTGGARRIPSPYSYSGYGNIIDKFPFSSDSNNATDVGDLAVGLAWTAGISGSAYGYATGGQADPGYPGPYMSGRIQKFPFSSDTNATDAADLSAPRSQAAGQNSDSYGYTSGGVGASVSNVIDKFPFSSDTNATDVGDLTAARRGQVGTSSTASGYTAGSRVPMTNIIDKFPFSSDSSASDVGDLTVSRGHGSSNQV